MVRESTTQKFSHKGVNGANSHDGFCLPKSPNLRKTTLTRAARDVAVLPPGSDRLRSRSKIGKISKRSILTNDSRRLRIKTLLLINLTSALVLAALGLCDVAGLHHLEQELVHSVSISATSSYHDLLRSQGF